MQKYYIAMLVPGMPFDGDTLQHKSLGGSETAGLQMAKELAALGHAVKVFSNGEKPGLYDGVHYLPTSDWEPFYRVSQNDVAIVQRTPAPFTIAGSSRLNFIWSHDLPMGRAAAEFRGCLWNVDRVLVLSEFMAERYRTTYGLTDETLVVTRNGIDSSLVSKDARKLTHNRKELIYSARPERGVDVLLDRIYPELLKAEPDLHLSLYGYENFPEHMEPFYAEINEKIKAFGDRVSFAGFLSKPELYDRYSAGGVYVYPTPSPRWSSFEEVSCISIMEAQMCGLPVVTSRRGALPETLARNAGRLIDGDPASDEYVASFVEQTLELVRDEAAWNKASRAGRRAAKKMEWSTIAEEWSEEIDRALASTNDDPVRLAYHFYRRSDILAAERALTIAHDEGKFSTGASLLATRIQDSYNFRSSPEAFAEHYAKGGATTDERLASAAVPAEHFRKSDERRFHAVADTLAARPDSESVLEFGSGHGWSTVYLHNRVGRSWFGVDVDPNAVKWARTFAMQHADKPGNLEFIVGDESIELGERRFDCLVLQEVLEHCVDPVAVVDKLERWVNPGGLVIITVPYGPSEYATWNWENFRNHLWEFDQHDLTDMFASKSKMAFSATGDHECPATGEPVGFHMVTYEVDGTPTGNIDWERKLRVQRPRMTLAANIIAGPGAEAMLDWCLQPLEWIVDEITIGDTGLSDLSRMIIAKYKNARIVPARDPIEHGFEAARNDVLDETWTDAVLWIDTDERLVSPKGLVKYVRHSHWQGFSIRQHHFAVDGEFRPDIPVRCFKLTPDENGRKIRFFGMIHEHPEFGINEGPGATVVLPDVHIAHVGYLSEDVRRQRFVRNSPNLQRDMAKYPERKLQKHFVIRDLTLMNRYEIQSTGGKIPESAVRRARDVVTIYREHFLGQGGFSGTDPLPYYTEALRILGEGIDVSFNIGANRDGQGDQMNGGYIARFATIEEAEVEISRRVRQRMEPLSSENW